MRWWSAQYKTHDAMLREPFALVRTAAETEMAGSIIKDALILQGILYFWLQFVGTCGAAVKAAEI
ncbi:MAG TPA: hypothetical protein VME86_03335 [Acidobacteriaceae bacterium]|nr:hypothetical protein [Acidobacteriaceae bacterium]